MVPLRAQYLFDPASSDRGGLKSLLFAPVPLGRDNDCGDSCLLFRTPAEFRLEGGQPEADSFVFCFGGPELHELEFVTNMVAELLGGFISEIVNPICRMGVSWHSRRSASL